MSATVIVLYYRWIERLIGPLAHLVEQGTFNPKVPGSSPGRPTDQYSPTKYAAAFPSPLPVAVTSSLSPATGGRGSI